MAGGSRRSSKPKRLTEAEIFALASEYEEAAEHEGRYKKAKESAKKVILQQLHELRKVRGIESDQYGRFTRITVVQNEHVEYDERGLWGDLTPAQRRLAFDDNVNLNALSADARKRVIAALTPEERKAVTTHNLNVEKLSQAVQKRKINGKTVAKWAEVVKNAPFIRISHGTGE